MELENEFAINIIISAIIIIVNKCIAYFDVKKYKSRRKKMKRITSKIERNRLSCND